jgi:hypothetical protein
MKVLFGEYPKYYPICIYLADNLQIKINLVALLDPFLKQ